MEVNSSFLYYSDKLSVLKRIFGTEDIILEKNKLIVKGKIFPIINDVIILLAQEAYSPLLKKLYNLEHEDSAKQSNFARDIQETFGKEWTKYDQILDEHQAEFKQYFDLANIADWGEKIVCDLGCGNGRWDFFLKNKCKNLILVDFSDAIFVARKNLQDAASCLFFMGDIKRLPFQENFADFIFSLGVLHHLPTNCLEEVRALKKSAPEILVYLYYALDNRPRHYKWLLKMVTLARKTLARIKSEKTRAFFTFIGLHFVYQPLILMGKGVERLFKKGNLVPLYHAYHDKSLARIKQDVYDRFFTGIEQRVLRQEIEALRDTFSEVLISDGLPYWHFLCKR